MNDQASNILVFWGIYRFMDNHSNSEQTGYLFNVDVLIKNNSNAKALERLISLLNSGDEVIDYRIHSGIELGEIIDSLLSKKKQSIIKQTSLNQTKNDSKVRSGASKEADSQNKKTAKFTNPSTPISGKDTAFASMAENPEFRAWIQKHITENRLVRIIIHRNGERINIPCRLLNFLPETYTLNVYHVDEKQVYTFKLSEIVDFIET